MAPVERSTVANATPETIWNTCFEEMKFETWDPDVTEVSTVAMHIISVAVRYYYFALCTADPLLTTPSFDFLLLHSAH
jgi:hypothetical protein